MDSRLYGENDGLVWDWIPAFGENDVQQLLAAGWVCTVMLGMGKTGPDDRICCERAGRQNTINATA